MFWFQAKKSFFEGKKCRNQCEFSSMINWQSGCSRHPLVLQMPHFIWKNLVQHFVFYSFFCFFSLWLSPSGKHQMDILKLQKKKDLNKRFLGRAIFRITRLFLVFLNVHPQYICLPPNYIAAASTLGREPMGKVRKTISILGVSRRPEKIVFSVQLPGVISQPSIVFENRPWLPLIYMGPMCALYST